MIHPVQYELETARHLDSRRRAAQERMAAQAEEVVSGDKPCAPLRSVIDWCVIRATVVRGGAA